MSGSPANTYRVGDFVYFDDPSAPDAPYQIRRIDELNRTSSGVEARAVWYARRRDIPSHLLKIADQAQRRFDNYYEVDKKKPENFNSRGFVVANGGEVKAESAEDSEIKKEDVEVPTVNDIDDKKGNEENEKTQENNTLTIKKDSEEIELKKKKVEDESTMVIDWGDGGLPLGSEKLSPEDRLKLRQHEVFLTRQSEIMPAHQIRGKCRVTLLGEVEECDNYLNAEETFFYSLVWDPVNLTLLADKGAIRVGDRFQARVDDYDENLDKGENGVEKMENDDDDDDDDNQNGALQIDEQPDEPKTSTSVSKSEVTEDVVRDVQVYHPYHDLTERDIDQFLIIARAVGTFARAIDSSSSTKIPTLHMAAACASRDVTVFHAMSLLHHANYDVGKAVTFLVPTANKAHYPLEVDKTLGNQTQTLGGPLLCRDQMEEWSTPEANLFEEALEKCGKDFNDIRADYLPWKSMRDIIEYYYQYKASNRYTERKKAKQAESESKLKQVYIPSYNKTTPSVIGTFNVTQNVSKSTIPCENCKTDESQNWYSWGGKSHLRLCQTCWFKWKKNAGLNRKHELERFDKNRPPVPVAPVMNGNDRQTSTPKPINQNVAVNPLKPNLGNAQRPTTFNNQALYQAAKAAAAKGQITQAQLIQLQQNLGITVPVVAKPASKPNIVYYTTICRRVLRRIQPKSALNPRRLARKPFSNIDHEAILKTVVIADRNTIWQTARSLAGQKSFKLNETEFHKGIIHLQHAMSAAAAAGKRPSSNTPVVGEPMPKLQKPSPETIKSLEIVGNTLLAVNRACARGSPYVHQPAMAGSPSGFAPLKTESTVRRRRPDSRYLDVKQHGVRYICGPRLK
ncbi:unnamed protein product [Caenorhabditis bovis]|uniref:Uncharacterized protein n=1 Tax=Caenorhabditis bovis TaxID=2654633 RepID=A0A8S1EA98_9PELO|nr:unnamed protein product [Caenorhabditis bovis]